MSFDVGKGNENGKSGDEKFARGNQEVFTFRKLLMPRSFRTQTSNAFRTVYFVFIATFSYKAWTVGPFLDGAHLASKGSSKASSDDLIIKAIRPSSGNIFLNS